MLTSNEKILHEAMREADRVKESVGQMEPPAVDDVLVAPTVVGEQLYGLVADERSIADAMFLLSRALDRGRLEGDVFVKVCFLRVSEGGGRVRNANSLCLIANSQFGS